MVDSSWTAQFLQLDSLSWYCGSWSASIYFPASQFKHVSPVSVERPVRYLPAAHVVQVTGADEVLMVPAAQEQEPSDVAPLDVDLPAGQDLQEPPLTLLYFPISQSSQL
tara:strand:+ start:252 stop:578 length:327 start_codon:yes stop_codon:yes gene_type:complete